MAGCFDPDHLRRTPDKPCTGDPCALLDQAMSELRQAGILEQLPVLANKAGQLLGVLRRLGEQHGTAMPRDVVLAMQGLRRWSLALQDGLRGYETASAPNAD
jgi:hypothetical protein